MALLLRNERSGPSLEIKSRFEDPDGTNLVTLPSVSSSVLIHALQLPPLF